MVKIIPDMSLRVILILMIDKYPKDLLYFIWLCVGLSGCYLQYPNYPECGERMEYVLQIDSDDNLDYMLETLVVHTLLYAKRIEISANYCLGMWLIFTGDITKLTNS